MKNPLAREKARKSASTSGTGAAKGKCKESIKGCKMILCEDPLTGDMRLFPVECPTGYIEKVKTRMREKGVKFSSEPFPEDAVLSIPEDEK